MREFNTSGPNIPTEHYTLERKSLIEKGINLVKKSRYFTIWAPRQTGKSTYFKLLANKLNRQGYKITQINVENYNNTSEEHFLNDLTDEIRNGWGIDFIVKHFSDLSHQIKNYKKERCILISVNNSFSTKFL